MFVTLHVFYTLSCRFLPHQCLSLRREESDVGPLTLQAPLASDSRNNQKCILQAPLASGSDACLVSVCELCGGFEHSVRAYFITYVCDICAYLDTYYVL